MVGTIQHLQKTQVTDDRSSNLIKGWNTMWLGMPNTTPSIELLKHWESIVSQSKLISVKEIIHDISK